MGPPSRAAADFLGGMQGADWTLFAGRPFHFVYQSWVLKILILADMLAMLVGSACGLLLWPLSIIKRIPIYEASYISAGMLFVLATGQWLVVGHLLSETIPAEIDVNDDWLCPGCIILFVKLTECGR
jgi:hypothetical protein